MIHIASYPLLKKYAQSTRTQGGRTQVEVPVEHFAECIEELVNVHELPLSLVFAQDQRKEKHAFSVHALLSFDETHEWLEVYILVSEKDPKYPSLTETVMAAHWYERYIHDMFGIIPENHPDLRRLVHHENIPNNTYPLRKDFAWNTKLPHAHEAYPMAHVQGEGRYEIPVGPIHAGIIEPGHFRFNTAGERIITLEGKLFFTHKGVEKIMEGKTPEAALPFAERVSGDMAAAHALAYCQAVENISKISLSKTAERLRTLVVELERVTMHIHDLSNMAGMGTGYTVMAAHGFRIKERMQRLSDTIFGNRFFRGFVQIGGVDRVLSNKELHEIQKVVASCTEEMTGLTQMALNSDGLRDRFETTGVLPKATAIAYGALGIGARGSGVLKDSRKNHPHAAYPEMEFDIVTQTEGDVFARFMVRAEEMLISKNMIDTLTELLLKEQKDPKTSFAVQDGEAVAVAEGWRGEILHFIKIQSGLIERMVIRDPSFCNWALFGELAPGNIVPDFPLCNKSLNLSYSGTDL